MAARILKDVLSNFISIDSVLEWLSSQNNASDVFVNEYKCNQVEFASYFLNFLREQSSLILQSSCIVETPRKIQNSSEKSAVNLKSEDSTQSTEKNTDFKSLDSFPALLDLSTTSKSNGKSCSRFLNSTAKECASLVKDNTKRCRRLELFPGKKENSPNGQESNVASSLANSLENRGTVAISTPKSSGKESIDIADYFSDVVNLDGSSDWSPGFKWNKDNVKNDSVGGERIKHNCNGVSTTVKSRTFSCDSASSRSRDSRSSRLVLGDFILNDVSSSDGRKDKKNRVRKRINPTRVNSLPPQFEGSSSFDTSSSLVEIESSVANEREILKMECANVLEQLGGKSFPDISKKESLRVFSTPSKKVIDNMNSPNYMEELKMLARIYSSVLDENYCQNIMIEFCFVISLLVIQDHPPLAIGNDTEGSYKNEDRKYLNSIENCVYFAVETLWLQRNVLVLLNLAALKLLSENKRIKIFNAELEEFLIKACIERQGKEAIKRQICETKGTRQGNVSFECETDNKDNFTNILNFHSFIKQRDLFYDILAIWEENHLDSNWQFSSKLDSKIRLLLSMSSDPTNLLHLARLFRSQLVTSCCGDYEAEDESDEEILQLFASVDPNKMLRLRARLRSTPKRQGPCPLPDFMGYQEFFKDFIISTSYTVFHYYLKNSLCDEILRLNDAEFTSDLEDDDSCLDEQTRNRYLKQINVLCLLAKFLGFLEFLPYRTDKQWSDRVLNVHCAVRQNLLPLFDLESCLKNAFIKHKLTVTLPWIVSYLSMIDMCSARLNTYQTIWKILITVYRQLKSCKNLMNSFYLKLILGWIFQLPNFPSDLFYNVLEDVSKCYSLELRIEFTVGLDSYNFIEENILYSVCPYLSEINSILTENSGCNVKHIRPVTQGSSATSQVTKQIQLRLEESFLHNQSSSTRKTIEFVTERVSSIAVKYLINDVISKVKEKALSEIMELKTDLVDVEAKVEAISEKCYADLMQKSEIESWHLCSIRSEKALSALLSLDVDEAVSEVCTQIVTRQSAEKVKRWIQTHITLAVIKKEFTAVINKKNKRLAEISDTSVDNWNSSFVTSAPSKIPEQSLMLLDFRTGESSVSQVLIVCREIMYSIYEEGKIVWTEIDDWLRMANKVIGNALEIFPSIEKTLLSLIVDLLVIICVRYEADFKKHIFAEFFKIFKLIENVNAPGSPLERIICPRNLALFLRDSKNRNQTWDNLGNIFLFLMQEGFLTQEQVETQLLSLLRQNWEKDEGVLFRRLFNHLLKHYTDKNGCDNFTLLLEWLNETLSDNGDSIPSFERDDCS